MCLLCLRSVPALAEIQYVSLCAHVYAGCAAAELDVTFLGEATDNGPHKHPVTLRGASTHEYGLTFDSGTDSFAEISNFIYADDSSFTIAMWISKEKCRSTAAEVLYSHSQDMDSIDLRDSQTSNLNIQLLCESAGAGRPEFDVSSLSGTAIRCEWPNPQALRACIQANTCTCTPSTHVCCAQTT